MILPFAQSNSNNSNNPNNHPSTKCSNNWARKKHIGEGRGVVYKNWKLLRQLAVEVSKETFQCSCCSSNFNKSFALYLYLLLLRSLSVSAVESIFHCNWKSTLRFIRSIPNPKRVCSHLFLSLFLLAGTYDLGTSSSGACVSNGSLGRGRGRLASNQFATCWGPQARLESLRRIKTFVFYLHNATCCFAFYSLSLLFVCFIFLSFCFSSA